MIITNIGQLVGIEPEGVLYKKGAEMASTGILKNAWLRIEDGRIADFGPMSAYVGSDESGSGMLAGVATPGHVVDAQGGMVMPAFCDSHTHLVYAGNREGEFLDKLAGLSYEEIWNVRAAFAVLQGRADAKIWKSAWAKATRAAALAFEAAESMAAKSIARSKGPDTNSAIKVAEVR